MAKEGRPLIFETPEDLKREVEAYFAYNEKPTLAGLAFALNINRQTLYNYENRDEYLDIIKKSRERVEAFYEERLIYGNAPTGVIFALKNMGWIDKVEAGLTNRNGEDVTPKIIFQPAPNCNAISDPTEE